MNEEKMIEVINNRINEMLQEEKIKSKFASFNTKKEAENWIMLSAVSTLIVPAQNRKAN